MIIFQSWYSKGIFKRRWALHFSSRFCWIHCIRYFSWNLHINRKLPVKKTHLFLIQNSRKWHQSTLLVNKICQFLSTHLKASHMLHQVCWKKVDLYLQSRKPAHLENLNSGFFSKHISFFHAFFCIFVVITILFQFISRYQ